MNLQVIASPDGEILWVSGPLPGAVHDLTAARIWGIVRELAAAGLIVLADKGYIGAGDPVRTPYRGRGKPASQKDANRATRGSALPASGQRPAQDLADPAQTPLLPLARRAARQSIHVLQTRETRMKKAQWRLHGTLTVGENQICCPHTGLVNPDEASGAVCTEYGERTAPFQINPGVAACAATVFLVCYRQTLVAHLVACQDKLVRLLLVVVAGER